MKSISVRVGGGGLLIVLALGIAACDVPKDPQVSTQRAIESGLKVGVVSNAPYTENDTTGTTGKGEWGGEEIELINGFARANNMGVEYVEGNETDLVKELEGYRLHLVAGGFEKGTVWKTKAGLSAPYDGNHVFLLPKGENRLLYHLEEFLLKMKEEKGNNR